MSRSAGPSHRLLRVGEELRHALAEVLTRGDLRDPALENVSITVSEVKLSPDLRHGVVFVMPLAGQDAGEVVTALDRSAGFLGAQVARRVRLKYFPRLTFRIDPSFDAVHRIETLLKDPHVAQDLRRDDGGADAAQPQNSDED
ncbi:MAG TPA: 30S ribosome-binding factor RbfA [Sphingomonadales bacterium]|jgi:ribosome-binding factor A